MFLYVREAEKNNTGLRVQAIQGWSGGSVGDNWCVEMLWMWLDLWTRGAAPFRRGLVCEEIRTLAQSSNWIVDVTDIRVGDLCLTVNEYGVASHVAVVTAVSPLTTIAGNASATGGTSDGTGVFEHATAPTGKVFVALPIQQTLTLTD